MEDDLKKRKDNMEDNLKKLKMEDNLVGCFPFFCLPFFKGCLPFFCGRLPFN
jgi:hypothetical protein